MARTRTRLWDAAEYLETDEDILAYLDTRWKRVTRLCSQLLEETSRGRKACKRSLGKQD